MQLKKIKSIEYLASICAFIYMFNPSLKFIYKSALFNIIPFILFFFIFLVLYVEREIYLKKSEGLFLCVVSIFFAIQLISMILSDQGTFINASRVISVYCSFLSGLIICKYIKFNVVIAASISWVILLCFGSFFGYIDYSSGEDYNHLNFTLPLGTILTWCLFRMFVKNEKSGLANLLIIVFLFYSILFAGSRAAIALPIFVSIVLACFIWRSLDLKRLLFFVTFFTISLFVSISYIKENLGSYFLYKVENMSNLKEDSRYVIYNQAIERILENPNGMGYGQYVKFLDAVYPHNLFLEVALNSGVIPALLLILLFIFTLIFSIYKLQKCYNQNCAFTLLFFCYSLVSWQLSYDFASSSVVFFTFGLVIHFLFNKFLPIAPIISNQFKK